MIDIASSILIPPLYGLRTLDFLEIGDNQNWEVAPALPFKPGLGNRIAILGANGIINLTIPVKKHKKQTSFQDIKVDHCQKWQRQHWRSIVSAYGKSPFFQFYKEELDVIFNQSTPLLADFTIPLLRWIHNQIFPKGQFSVNLSLNFNKKNEYNLLHLSQLSDKAIQIAEQPYRQVFGDKFVIGLSVIDAILCEGPGYFKFQTE